MNKIKILFVILALIPLMAMAQKEKVSIKSKSRSPQRKFEYHQASNFDMVNGKMNVALNSANGYLFEITSIAVKSLKCKKTLKSNEFTVVLIDNSLNRTYISKPNSKATLHIQCLPNGSYVLIYKGDLYFNKQRLTIHANLQGSINHSQNLKTN
ncbi:MAG: hypothetical protein K9H61_07330 [Bacteroidia bacterium]|nr:hypothetical protein [Bacteroidia bacterium]MCF8446792.1 hypothetical protein [Bacteroidia bacterium]